MFQVFVVFDVTASTYASRHLIMKQCHFEGSFFGSYNSLVVETFLFEIVLELLTRFCTNALNFVPLPVAPSIVAV